MIIIPAIDIMDGKCVRLTQGDFSQQKIYDTNPVNVAKQFEEEGIQRLHMVDLDGAKAGTVKNLIVLEKIATATNLVIDFGGGIKKIEDVINVLNAGAALVTVGSIAVKQPDLLQKWVEEFGATKFLIGADVLNEKIKISGWLEATNLSIFDFIENMLSLKLTNIFCTDISKDGLMEGPSINLYKKIMHKYSQVNLIASGGVSCINDVVALNKIGCSGAIIGKAIYEKKVTVNQLLNYIL